MEWRIVVGLVATIVPTSVALAQNLPSHEDVCVWPLKDNGQEDTSGLKIVSKEKLAKAILKGNEAWMKLYVDASDRPSEARFAPQWRRIFTDPKFCVGDPGCFAEPIPTPGSPPPPPGTKHPATNRRHYWRWKTCKRRLCRPFKSTRSSGNTTRPPIGKLPPSICSARTSSTLSIALDSTSRPHRKRRC